MEQQLSLFSENPPAPLTVSEVNAQVRALLEADPILQDVWVQGEVSNLSLPRSGHMYFTIKDSDAALRCVMWRGQVARLSYRPQDGDAVEVHGSVSVYEAGGQYQLYADQIRPAGAGLLYQQFLELKEKLQAEGLFDEARKRPLPPRPAVIGIVTSATGAALRDMLNTLRRRYPLARVVLSPAAVQGAAAPGEVIAALQALNAHVQPDVILVGRGGGSIEDLWAFNDEGVARAIAASPAPVVSGVGHETDFTIADFVADRRAPTPTAAAELATPDQAELRADLYETQEMLARLTADLMAEQRWALRDVQHRLLRLSPQARLRNDRQRLDEYARRAGQALAHQIALQRSALAGLGQQLAALNPQGVLRRGYAVVTDAAGMVVTSVDNIQVGDALQVRLADGEIDVEVKEHTDE